MVSHKKLPDDQLKIVRQELTKHEVFRRTLKPTIPLQYITAFLLVAEEEGLGVVDYAKKAGVPISVMSRHLLDIGERNRKMADGYGLVTYRANPMELRKHEYYLTDKGRAVLAQLVRAVR